MNKRNFLEPYQFKNGMVVKNRIVLAPMTTSSSFYDGQVTNDEIDYYHMRSGGPGIVVTAVANVADGGKGFEGQMAISDDRYIAGLRRVAEAINVENTKSVIQIFHAGRMTNSAILRGRETVSASAIAAPREGSETPRELAEAEIEIIIQQFADAILRAIKAGFDGVELHGANTYLIQQFLSPHSNRRTDKWGGTLENRMRFPLEIIRRAQEVIKTHAYKPFLLGYRISPEEYETPGIRMSETLEFINVLKTRDIDYLHLSLSNVWQTPVNNANDTIPITTQVKEVLGEEIPLITVGSIETPDEAEKVIEKGVTFVAMGKTLIREPKWVQKVERHDEDSIRYTLSKSDYPDLAIPAAMRHMLETIFKDVINFSAD